MHNIRETTMNPVLGRFTFLLPACLAFLASQEAFGQDEQTVAYSLRAGSSRFTQEQVIEGGDVSARSGLEQGLAMCWQI